MNTPLRPQWLPGQAAFPQTSARTLIERAYDLASTQASYDETYAMFLVGLLMDLKSDASLIAAALLVRPMRANEIAPDDIAAAFNPAVARILGALNDLALIDRLHEKKQSDLEQLRKMLLAIAADMRAVVLKLALQVVLMRRIENATGERRQRLALQTRDLFAPLANRLGIAQLKWELEDSALRVLEPEIFQEITTALEERRVDRERYIQRIIALLEYEIKNAGIQANKIYGRVKHINSIYLKMKRKNLKFSEVNDIRAVRIEVENKEECYSVLSIVNSLWQPIAAEFDDYIAQPKANGYQSLHCSFIGPENRTLEVQIRTSEMHEHAELGVAAHWLYKEKGAQHSKQFEQQIEWLRRILEGGGAQGDAVFDQFRNEAFRDRVYAVSPQGRVVDLPEGSTALDFAYHIHTQLGHRCRGAKINNKIVTLTTALRNGDVVEILTYKEANPSRDWLNDHLGYLQSGRAKAKVRSYFKKLEREKSIEAGQEMLQRECKRLGVPVKAGVLDKLSQKFNVKSSEDLYEGIGFGEISVLMVAHELAAGKSAQNVNEDLDARLARLPIKAAKKQHHQSVEVEGVDDLMVNFASCCQPVPPAEIVGFITSGRGVNIHRKDCPNIEHLGKMHPQRIIEVNWNEGVAGLFSVEISFEAQDRSHLLRDITQVFSNEKSSVINGDIKHSDHNHILGTFTLEIADMGQLSRIIDRMAQIKSVQSVQRVQY